MEQENKELKRKDERRVNKEEAKDVKFSKTGCEKQYKFNSKVMEVIGDDHRRILENHFSVIPEDVENSIKKGEKLLRERNKHVRIADELGWDGLEKFEKEELAENADEEKRLKLIRKEKRDKEEKKNRGGKGGFYGYHDKSGERRDYYKDGDRDRDRSDRKFGGSGGSGKCFICDQFGHLARDCLKRNSKDDKRNKEEK